MTQKTKTTSPRLTSQEPLKKTDDNTTEAEEAATVAILMDGVSNSETQAITKSKPTQETVKDNKPSLALLELIMELRDTVKRLNPKRQTTKNLRRSLSCVRDILNEIDALEDE